MIFVIMISYTDCEHIEYNSKLIEKLKLFDINQSEALCELLGIQRNLLNKVEEPCRNGCPLQDVDKSRFYSDHSTLPKPTIRSKF